MCIELLDSSVDHFSRPRCTAEVDDEKSVDKTLRSIVVRIIKSSVDCTGR